MKWNRSRVLRLVTIALIGGVAIAAAARWRPRATHVPHVVAGDIVARLDFTPGAGASATLPSSAPAEGLIQRQPAPAVIRPQVNGVNRSPVDRSAAAAAIPVPLVPIETARAALDAVGADPDADAVWVAAINDPALTSHERSDLIEDLNENGFADPDHVGADELPLVFARLDLIEQLAPDAMDDVNAAAFAEAYKDLSKIADDLTR